MGKIENVHIDVPTPTEMQEQIYNYFVKCQVLCECTQKELLKLNHLHSHDRVAKMGPFWAFLSRSGAFSLLNSCNFLKISASYHSFRHVIINRLIYLSFHKGFDFLGQRSVGAEVKMLKKWHIPKWAKNDKLSLISVLSTNCTTFILWYVKVFHVSIMLYSGKIRMKLPLYRILEIYSIKWSSLNGIYPNKSWCCSVYCLVYSTFLTIFIQVDMVQ